MKSPRSKLHTAIAFTVLGVCLLASPSFAQGPPGGGRPPGGGVELVDLTLKENYAMPSSDAQTSAIVASAEAFLATLTEAQREAAVFEFTDNAQRGNWSNLPEGIVRRSGVRLGDLTRDQRAALDALLAETLSESGVRNVELQMLADDTLTAGGRGSPNFGSDFYFVSFLGEPSTSAPWMLQFGGHHLAINATFFGADASYSPMLTGGQPIQISYEGNDVIITERELSAARAFMGSLSAEQQSAAVRSDRAINLLLGPGKFGTLIAPEGIGAATLTGQQKTLLLDVIAARLGFINDDDFQAAMARLEGEIDQTYFGWWGPLDVPGGAYFRITGPSIVMEYAPQGGGRGGAANADHVHAMYRDPRNDYGSAWIRVGP